MGIPLADAHPRGLCQSRSGGSGPRLAVGCRAVALVPIATAWAVISGGLLLAAAHRLSGSEGRWILVVAGVVSAGWGALVAILGASDTRTMGLWLVGYALIFGGTLVALAGRWRRATTHLS
jgi:uncharacterized membrane protein HdeD (DUF308 family)